MTSFDLVSAAAVLAMVGGLAAVLWEVLTQDPRSLLEMMDDSRRFAEAPVAAPAHQPEASASTAAAATPEHPRLAACARGPARPPRSRGGIGRRPGGARGWKYVG